MSEDQDWPEPEITEVTMTSGTPDLNAALAKAQGAMSNAKFNRQNPHFKNRYADLAAIIDAIKKPLADNGLGYTQVLALRDGALLLVTTLRHPTGQCLESVYPLPMPTKPQEFGSALTYAKRYSLSSLIGIAADEDDDAEVVSKANGAATVISDQQAVALQERIMEVDASIQKFLAFFGIDSVTQLPANRHAEAVAMLDKFAERKAKMK